jgi:glycosyltransferase involved in cell wall biosynthesis
MTAKVTIVIATYHRPDALAAAISSVILQTEQNWKLLVIGDHCTDRTESVVHSFADPRIHFINLPARCMEQALPNSVGMMLADTPYIALLNHDDMWLPDHLATGLATLKQSQVEWYIGHTAIARHYEDAPHGKYRPFFTEENPPQRKLSQAFFASHVLFEPASAWIFRRELIHKVGLWRATLSIYRTPIQDWVMRAWRKRTRVHIGTLTTALKFGTQYKSSSDPAYQQKAYEQEYVLKFLRRFGVHTLRRLAKKHIRQNSESVREAPQSPWDLVTPPTLLSRLLLNRVFAWIYCFTGMDSYTLYSKVMGISKSSIMINVTQRRTGEVLRAVPDFDVLLRYARASLS